MRLSTLVLVILTSSRLGEQRQDTVGDVDSNDLRRTQALALRADAASGVASIDFRSDCISSSLVCAMISSTFARNAGFRSLTSTTCMLRMTGLDCCVRGVCPSG